MPSRIIDHLPALAIPETLTEMLTELTPASASAFK
jgi:hypothetical protein